MSGLAPAVESRETRNPPDWRRRGLINQAVQGWADKGIPYPLSIPSARRIQEGAPVTDYTIAAIPTVYRGRQYRSRLEARWAAFFDLLGWRHEYEPFDLGEWSPDFLLLGCEDAPILAEVKPISSFNNETADRMLRASWRNKFHEQGSLLLLGASPMLITDPFHHVSIGWAGHLGTEKPEADWYSAILYWAQDADKPRFCPDILFIDPSGLGWSGTFTYDCGPGDGMRADVFYHEYSMSLWAQATNAVQYHPGDVR